MFPYLSIKASRSVGIIVLCLGISLSFLPLLWPLTAQNVDPHYGTLPLWVLANCGVIAIASIFSFLVICLLHRQNYLWISLIGMICVIISLLTGFLFWMLGILLFPIAPAILIATAILASNPEPASNP